MFVYIPFPTLRLEVFMQPQLEAIVLLLLRVTVLTNILLVVCCHKHLMSHHFFSSTNGDPHRSSFKFHTAVFCVLRVIFHVQRSFVVSLFPGTAFRFFFKPFFTIPVAPRIPGTITHVIFHIHCISTY